MSERVNKLAEEVLLLARNTLLVNLRFLDVALGQFVLSPSPWPLATDGSLIFYAPRHILLLYKEEQETVTRDYLHLLLHCVFRHMYIPTPVNRNLWDLACDIAVEAAIGHLNLPCVASARQLSQKPVLASLRKEVPQFTAEKLYHHFLSCPPQDIGALAVLFRADDHGPWYEPPQGNDGKGKGSAPGQGDRRAERSRTTSNKAARPGGSDDIRMNARTDMEDLWANIAERMQAELEEFSKLHGTQAGALIQNLREVNREKYDYTEFLKRFAVHSEVMQPDPDEFDYIFYTYGLQLYQNMPLIEPLEYREVKRIREFVIAIDTSGSVSGELVQTFVQKTYNILQSTQSFSSKINLHIIQCDAAIQEDVTITSRAEFDRYLKTMTIKGLGGTDFRPVFTYVNELRAKKHFLDLRGIIYLTDGYGTFPERRPDYDVAFVFLEDEYNDPDVPPWAIKLILQKDEI